jgi:hypothetical protein
VGQGSHDVFIWRAPLLAASLVAALAEVLVGAPGYENRFLYELEQAGWAAANPCLTIRRYVCACAPARACVCCLEVRLALGVYASECAATSASVCVCVCVCVCVYVYVYVCSDVIYMHGMGAPASMYMRPTSAHGAGRGAGYPASTPRGARAMCGPRITRRTRVAISSSHSHCRAPPTPPASTTVCLTHARERERECVCV